MLKGSSTKCTKADVFNVVSELAIREPLPRHFLDARMHSLSVVLR